MFTREIELALEHIRNAAAIAKDAMQSKGPRFDAAEAAENRLNWIVVDLLFVVNEYASLDKV